MLVKQQPYSEQLVTTLPQNTLERSENFATKHRLIANLVQQAQLASSVSTYQTVWNHSFSQAAPVQGDRSVALSQSHLLPQQYFLPGMSSMGNVSHGNVAGEIN